MRDRRPKKPHKRHWNPKADAEDLKTMPKALRDRLRDPGVIVLSPSLRLWRVGAFTQKKGLAYILGLSRFQTLYLIRRMGIPLLRLNHDYYFNFVTFEKAVFFLLDMQGPGWVLPPTSFPHRRNWTIKHLNDLLMTSKLSEDVQRRLGLSMLIATTLYAHVDRAEMQRRMFLFMRRTVRTVSKIRGRRRRDVKRSVEDSGEVQVVNPETGALQQQNPVTGSQSIYRKSLHDFIANQLDKD